MDTVTLQQIVMTSGIVISAAFFIKAYIRYEKAQIIKETPTIPIEHIVKPGYYEVKGIVESKVPFMHPVVPNVPLVYCLVKISEEFQERDEDGRVHKYWTEVDSFEYLRPFSVVDSTGDILVDPRGSSEIDCPVIARETSSGILCAAPDGGGVKRVKSPLALRDKIEIHGLRVGCQIYLIGPCHSQKKMGDGYYFCRRKSDGDDPFIISSKSEEEIIRGEGFGAKYWLAGGIFMLIFALIITFLIVPDLGPLDELWREFVSSD